MLIALLATALLLVVLVLVKPWAELSTITTLNSFLTLALIAIFLLGTNAFCPLWSLTGLSLLDAEIGYFSGKIDCRGA